MRKSVNNKLKMYSGICSPIIITTGSKKELKKINNDIKTSRNSLTTKSIKGDLYGARNNIMLFSLITYIDLNLITYVVLELKYP